MLAAETAGVPRCADRGVRLPRCAQAPRVVLQKCPRCQAMKRPHHVCAECGYYAGEQRVAAREA
jgi:ribosomal protein L32